ncbi:T9SS type A sorting domain-containing protein [Algibacter sp. AS12]|uniref:T9SS type A sorting domain-containing protein n=1 Tax=Algibacter sp. AS12 TaxID=3135773 RepID=UPI00398B4E69
MKKSLLSFLAIGAIASLTAQDITTGLVFHLDGNETISPVPSGNEIMATIGGTGAIADGMIIAKADGADGTPNGALVFNGTSAIEFDASTIAGLPAGLVDPAGKSYSAWIKTNVDATDTDILSYGVTSNRNHVHFHYKGAALNFGHYRADFKFNDITIVDDAWHNLIMVFTIETTYDAPPNELDVIAEVVTGELFLDGISQGTATYDNLANPINTDIVTNTAFSVGSRNYFAGDFLTGSLDDIRIYNRALTSADAVAVFQANGGTLSTANMDVESNFALYPNPTSLGYINISSRNNAKIDVSVYDIFGKEVIKATVAERLDVSALKSGMYIVKVSQDGAKKTSKLVIE